MKLNGILAATVAVAGLWAGHAVAQDAMELRFAVATPEMVHYNKELFIPWAEKVSAESNGTVSVKMYFAGALGKEGQFVDIVESGAADIALDIAAYYPGRFPLTDVASLPLLIDGAVDGSRALWSMYENGNFGTEFDGMKVLAISTPPAAALMTKGVPVSMPSDLDGLKIAGGGEIKGWMIDDLGAAPVNVKIFDIYQSVDRGVIDGMISYYTAVPPFKFNEVVTHSLDVPSGASFMFVFMSQEKFDSLPEDAQKAIDANSGAAMSEAFGEVWHGAEQVGRKMMEGSGVEIRQLDEGQTKAWTEALSPVITKWEENVEGGADAVEALRAELAKSAS